MICFLLTQEIVLKLMSAKSLTKSLKILNKAFFYKHYNKNQWVFFM